jgi:hypothetical protein
MALKPITQDSPVMSFPPSGKKAMLIPLVWADRDAPPINSIMVIKPLMKNPFKCLFYFH